MLFTKFLLRFCFLCFLTCIYHWCCLLQTSKVLAKPTKILDVPSFTNQHSAVLQKNFSEITELLKIQEPKLQVMIDKIDNLTAALDQIKKDKLCEINKLLWH